MKLIVQLGHRTLICDVASLQCRSSLIRTTCPCVTWMDLGSGVQALKMWIWIKSGTQIGCEAAGMKRWFLILEEQKRVVVFVQIGMSRKQAWRFAGSGIIYRLCAMATTF